MHQQPPKTPSFASTSPANASQLDSSRDFTVYPDPTSTEPSVGWSSVTAHAAVSDEARGDVGVVDDQARRVVLEHGREVVFGRVIEAAVLAAAVRLVQPPGGEVERLHVRGGGGDHLAGRKDQAVDGEHVRARRRLDVDVDQAVELGRPSAVDCPGSLAVGDEDGLAPAGERVRGDAGVARAPAVVEGDLVAQGVRLPALDGRGVAPEPSRRDVDDLEAVNAA